MIARRGQRVGRRAPGRAIPGTRASLRPKRGLGVGLSLDAYGSLHWADVAGGVLAAAADRGWQVIADPDGMPSPLTRLIKAGYDGVISAIATAADLRAARQCPVPIVNVSEMFAAVAVPTVTFDNLAIGRLAAEHLIDQGYARFGFFGLEEAAYSARRREGFLEAVRQHGQDCSLLETSRSVEVGLEAATVVDRWLLSLPEGTGILAVSDSRGQVLLDACRRLGIDVPGRLGVVGVGDFRALCDSTLPPLSSVQRNGPAVGEAAVRLLARLLAGERLSAAAHRVAVAPAGVSARESTARGGADDGLALRAVTLVKDNITEPCDVATVARRLRVSRRKLERAFQSVFGETPRLRLLRIHAGAALTARARNPGVPLAAIARAAGFSDARHLRRALGSLGLSDGSLK